jgi:hypothetical protein
MRRARNWRERARVAVNWQPRCLWRFIRPSAVSIDFIDRNHSHNALERGRQATDIPENGILELDTRVQRNTVPHQADVIFAPSGIRAPITSAI